MTVLYSARASSSGGPARSAVHALSPPVLRMSIAVVDALPYIDPEVPIIGHKFCVIFFSLVLIFALQYNDPQMQEIVDDLVGKVR